MIRDWSGGIVSDGMRNEECEMVNDEWFFTTRGKNEHKFLRYNSLVSTDHQTY